MADWLTIYLFGAILSGVVVYWSTESSTRGEDVAFVIFFALFWFIFLPIIAAYAAWLVAKATGDKVKKALGL